MGSTAYSLSKSRKIFRKSCHICLRKKSLLAPAAKTELQELIDSLQEALHRKDRDASSFFARRLEESIRKSVPKTLWDRIWDFGGGLLFALAIAIAVRQMWFEFYTIPSGSMRPTLKENDFLLVSKTDFGINTPTPTSHVYFDPNLVQRGSIVVFSGANMDIPDTATKYFFIVPGTKQYVKRLIGKPGDTLYFYGGKIYGVDAAGNDIAQLRQAAWSDSLEHIPYIRFDGKLQSANPGQKYSGSSLILYQMNEPAAKLSISSNGIISGEMLYPKNRPLSSYGDLWGFKHFAMARLLSPAEAKQLHPRLMHQTADAPLYLELTHHPSLQGTLLVRDEYGRLRPQLGTNVSLLPFDEEKIDSLMNHMTTGRFIVKNGRAARLGGSFDHTAFLPELSNVPDGTYEIQDGEASRIFWSGVSVPLGSNHPLLSRDIEHVRVLYNLGIEFDTRFLPSAKNTQLFPSRYAYFRSGDLYLLGAPIVRAGDPALIEFTQKEYQKQTLGTSYFPYEPFVDLGPPLKQDGSIDVDFIRRFGISIPKGMYLVLGDNHAMSGDSRQFGFVPEANLRGGPSFILWPPGSRWGRLLQPSFPYFSLPNIAIWSVFLICAAGSSIYLRRKYKKPCKLSD